MEPSLSSNGLTAHESCPLPRSLAWADEHRAPKPLPPPPFAPPAPLPPPPPPPATWLDPNLSSSTRTVLSCPPHASNAELEPFALNATVSSSPGCRAPLTAPVSAGAPETAISSILTPRLPYASAGRQGMGGVRWTRTVPSAWPVAMNLPSSENARQLAGEGSRARQRGAAYGAVHSSNCPSRPHVAHDALSMGCGATQLGWSKWPPVTSALPAGPHSHSEPLAVPTTRVGMAAGPSVAAASMALAPRCSSCSANEGMFAGCLPCRMSACSPSTLVTLCASRVAAITPAV